MNAKDIKIGTKLEIEIPEFYKKDDESTTSYVSQLVDVIDDDTISIASPMGEGRFKFLSRDSKIIIYYLNERHELLYFKGQVKGHKKHGALDIFDVLIISDFNKIQRRRFYRLDVVLSCQYKVIDEQAISTDSFHFEKLDETQLKPAYTKDISGSGFCMILEEALDPKAVLDISINLEDSAIIRVFAQVIRTVSEKNKRYEVGLHYIKISQRDSDILTRYIFEKQRQILKNTMQAKLK